MTDCSVGILDMLGLLGPPDYNKSVLTALRTRYGRVSPGGARGG